MYVAACCVSSDYCFCWRVEHGRRREDRRASPPPQTAPLTIAARNLGHLAFAPESGSERVREKSINLALLVGIYVFEAYCSQTRAKSNNNGESEERRRCRWPAHDETVKHRRTKAKAPGSLSAAENCETLLANSCCCRSFVLLQRNVSFHGIEMSGARFNEDAASGGKQSEAAAPATEAPPKIFHVRETNK